MKLPCITLVVVAFYPIEGSLISMEMMASILKERLKGVSFVGVL